MSDECEWYSDGEDPKNDHPLCQKAALEARLQDKDVTWYTDSVKHESRVAELEKALAAAREANRRHALWAHNVQQGFGVESCPVCQSSGGRESGAESVGATENLGDASRQIPNQEAVVPEGGRAAANPPGDPNHRFAHAVDGRYVPCDCDPDDEREEC